MARITVEDCVTKIPNRFELVMLAAQRARDVSAGAPLTVERDNDKNPVVALREIADETVELDHLRYELIHGLRRHVEIEEEAGEEMVPGYDQEQPEVAHDPLMLIDTDEGFEMPAPATEAQISSEDEQPSDRQPLFG